MSDSPSRHAPPSDETIEEPPQTTLGILYRLGPGLIVAAAIVGSGELIATTATGAAAGFHLLWLIIIGCVIKVFIQVEFGRYTIVSGQTTMFAMNETPGPTFRLGGIGGNWLIWYWLVMFVVSLGQLGGIVGGVGQALAITVPLTSVGREYNEAVAERARLLVDQAQLQQENGLTAETRGADAEWVGLERQIRTLKWRLHGVATGAPVAEGKSPIRDWFERRDANGDGKIERDELPPTETAAWDWLVSQINPGDSASLSWDELKRPPPSLASQAWDDRYWATIVAVLTSVLLVVGQYGFIQTFSTVLIALFTLITIGNLVSLQGYEAWAIRWDDLATGLSFRLPEVSAADKSPVVIALATFGIIGVGANELIAYPYWCLEKGYARFAGPRDETPQWFERARGWLSVMRWDAWVSMAVYTFATIAFYLLGASILHRTGLVPGDTELVQTLSTMYEPVFGPWTGTLFLFGAFAVLYSTYFVSNASHARVCADAVSVFRGQEEPDEETLTSRIRIFAGVFPLLCLVVYLVFPRPAILVFASGVMQGMMLPMLAGAALFFRYQRCDKELQPSLAWDVFLWLSGVGMLLSGGWTAVTATWEFMKLYITF